MFRSWRSAVFAMVLASMLSACAHRYSPPELRPADAVFPGLWDALAANAEADFLYVHGMCHHTVGDARQVFERVATPLGLAVEIDREGEPVGSHGGRLHRGKMGGQGRTVNLFAIVWSPISATPKRALCFDVVGGNGVCPASDGSAVGHRATINRQLKDRLLDECLADAVFYAGERGHEAIGGAVQEAHEPGEDRPLLIYTESLGSKILIDALHDPRRWVTAAFAGWYRRPVQVFMGANQLPLLSLATDPTIAVAGAPLAEINGIQRQANRIAALMAGARPIPVFPKREESRNTVVAFDDPNDLLSYPLRPYASAPPELVFIDVFVSNAAEYAGLIESPLAAHTGYRDNPDVQRMIACGSRALVGGCPKQLPALQ